MALNDLQTMRSLLRSRLNEAIPDKFTNPELNTIISHGQFDVARRLLKINKSWFAENTNLTIVAGVATLPSDCMEIESVISADMINMGTFTEIPLSERGRNKNKLFQYEHMNNDGFYVHVSDELHFITEQTYSTLPSSVILYYIKKPTELSAEDDTTIIPTEFVDFILAYAEWRCAPKSGQNPKEKEAAYLQLFIDLSEALKRDVQKAPPGGNQ